MPDVVPRAASASPVPTPPQVSAECVYATAGWGVHDERWTVGLSEVGLSPVVISLGRDAAGPEQLRQAVASAARGGRPVLAGPLTTVTRPLADLDLRLVGLSWGHDLADADPGDLAWLTRLRGLVVDSEANRTVALEAGLAAERITFLPWGIDLDTFSFAAGSGQRLAIDVPEGALLVLSLRAHEEIYRVSDIIRAFARLPGVAGTRQSRGPFLVVGHSGSRTADLRSLTEDLGIADRVRFIGTVPEPELAPLLAHAACYVTASRVDGTSVTLLQAMACGAPVVASDTPGNLGWVDDGVTGFTFPTGDVEGLAAAMSRAIAERPREMLLRARAEVEESADWHANLVRLRRALDTA